MEQLVMQSMPPDNAAAPLNLAGTRRAPRFKMIDGVEVRLDGKTATLVDLSLVGAQLVTVNRFLPNQRVRFTFEDQGKVIRIRTSIVSASFEVVEGKASYRIGVEFFDVDEAPLQRLIDSKRKRLGKTPRIA